MSLAHQLDREFADLVRQERRITKEIIRRIAEFEVNHCYAVIGFDSIMSWLVEGHGYSKSAAFRRMEAARLVRSVPEAIEKIADGSVNLTTLSSLNAAIRKEEARTQTKLSTEAKQNLVEAIESKSCIDVQRIIATNFPELDLEQKEFVKPVSATETKFNLIFTEEQVKVLQRLKEVTSHSHFNASWSTLIIAAVEEYLKRHDPLLKKSRKPIDESDVARGASASSQEGIAVTNFARFCPRKDEAPSDSNTKIGSEASSSSNPSSNSSTNTNTNSNPSPNSSNTKPALATAHSRPRTAARKALSWTEKSRATKFSRSGREAIAPSQNQTRPKRQNLGSAPELIRSKNSDEHRARRNPSSATEPHFRPNLEPLAQRLRAQVIQKSGGNCLYVDPVSGRRCTSRSMIEVDHIVSRARGGSNRPDNLRSLCRTHNRLMAQLAFGSKFIERASSRPH